MPAAVAGETPGEGDILPIDRTARRIAADLRLNAARLSRLMRRMKQESRPTVEVSRLSQIMDAVGLLVVAAHLVERPGSSDVGHTGTERRAAGAANKSDDPRATANWLAAFVVGVVMDREPTEHDTEELLRLAAHDRTALEAALHRVTEIDDLAEPVRLAALGLLRSGLRRLD